MSYLCAPFFHEQILLRYAQDLTGCTLGKLSNALLNHIPGNLKINKGFTGRLIEKYLGIVSNNQAQQDFDTLGIELKTIPINKNRYPIEDTFICSISVLKTPSTKWENSYLYNKIKRVLWIPIESNRDITTISERIIQKPFLWSPSKKEKKLIKKDWKDFIDLIISGKIESITGEYGQVIRYLKRLKKKYKTGLNIKQRLIYTSSCFYFRKQFTHSILSKNN